MSIFYIVKTNGFYQLRFSMNHFCISSGPDLSTRLKVAEKCLKRYKTKEGLLKMLQSLEYGCSVPPTDVSRCVDLIRRGETYCTEELKLLEKDCAEFIENNTPLKRTKRIIGKVLKNKTPHKEEKTVEIKCEVKRPTLFKRTLVI